MDNKIKDHLSQKQGDVDIYNQSGVYQIQRGDCPLKYVGQTGRTFKARYKEHIHDVKTNKQNSRFAQHILDAEHNYTPIDQSMRVLMR
jgi:hypothetical protein